jgi:hypothetical protein
MVNFFQRMFFVDRLRSIFVWTFEFVVMLSIFVCLLFLLIVFGGP